MNYILTYLLCIYITVDVEADPRIFLNGVYTNTNRLDKYYVNNAERTGNIKATRKDIINIKECVNTDRREECLNLLKILEKEPKERMRRLNKNPFLPYNDYVSGSSEGNDKSLQEHTKFSQDYLDINDLLRSGAGGVPEYTLIKQKPKKRENVVIIRPNKFDRFTFDLTKFRRNNRKKKKVYVSESDSSSSSESLETVRTHKVAKNKRFQIADSSLESDSSEEIPVRKRKKKTNKKYNLMYMQSPSRLYDLRRRLPHFFPKRYHWNEDDIKDLRNYWFSGPQGKYWGQQTL